MSDGPSGPALGLAHARTDAGRAEIQQRRLQLPRTARNLLLIIDPSRTAADWLALVQGAQVADLQALVGAGLVAPVAAAAALPQAAAAGNDAGSPTRMSLAQALQTKRHEVLCRRVVAEARPRLGRVRGYMLVVEVESCVSADDIRALALKFVEQVRQRDGDKAAIDLAQVLISPD